MLACLLALMFIPFTGAGKTVHAASPTWATVGQTEQPSKVQTFLKAGGTLYAGTGSFTNNDVWANSDGTWTRMSGSPSYVRTLLMDAAGTLYAGAWGDGNNVSTYTAGGGWQQMIGSPGNVYSLIDFNGTIYAGASNGPSNDVWTYTAGGGWSQMSGSPGDVQSLTDINGTLYALTLNNGAWAYSNGAWEKITGLPKFVVSLVDVDGTLYAGASASGINRVWTYNNGTWTQMGDSPGRVQTLLNVDGTLYVGTTNWADDVWTYTVSGGWKHIYGSPAMVYALFDDNGTLYAGTQTGDKDIWTYSNGTWAQMGIVPGNTNTLFSAGGTLYAGTDDDTNGVWAYTASGGWTRMSGSPGYVYAFIEVDGTLYAGACNDDNDIWTYDTTAAAPVWTQMTTSHAPSNVYAFLNIDGTLYAGTNNGDHDIWTYDTTADAPEWTQMTDGNVPSYVNALINVNGTLYAGTGSGMGDLWTYDTTEAAPEWTQMTDGVASTPVYALINVNGTLYAGTAAYDNDVWTYDTTAATPEWIQMSDSPGGVGALLYMNGTLYAGTDNSSDDLWSYSNDTWTQVSGSPSQLHALLGDNGNLYAAGTYGVEQLIAPGTPANLQFDSTTTESTTLTWDAVAGATGYYIYENGGFTAIDTVTEPAYTVSDLTPNTSYTFAVSAFNAAGESAQSGAIPVRTLSAVSTDATLTSTIGTVSADGTADESITDVPYGTTLDELKAAITPAADATFEVYDADGTTVATTLATGTKVIVTAQDETTQVTYTVTVNLNKDATLTSTIGTVSAGGTADESITDVPYGTTLDELKAAITPAANATFEVYNADGTTVATTLATGTKVIVTAQDETTKVTYTVTVNLSTAATLTSTIGTVSADGTADESITDVPYGTTLDELKAAITPAADATFEVYDADGTTVATALATGKKVIVTAQDGTTQVTYTVTVNLNTDATLTSTIGTVSAGGTADESITGIPYGTTLDELKAAITPAADATFEVYNADGTTVATALATGKKVIVTAQDGTTQVTYTVTVIPAPTYTVTYSGNGAASGSAPTDSGSYAQGAAVSVNGNTGNLTKTGYTFAGWNTAADGGGTSYAAGSTYIMGTSNVTLYAMWTIDTYTVSFNSNGGSAVGSQSVNYNLLVTKPADPTRSGYTFGGWYSDGGWTAQFNFATPITANTILYAKWTANETGGPSGDGDTPSVPPAGNNTVPPTSNTVISTNGTLTLPIGRSGEVSLGDEVKIIIPADASAKELKITIEKLADTQKLLTSKNVPVSSIFEILKNFTENFNKEITMTFTFDPQKLKGAQKPSVFFYDEIKKVWVEVGGEVKGSTITIKVNHFTKYAVFAAGQGADAPTDPGRPISFSDIAGHWAEASIKQAVSLGIVSGYPDGTFNPNRIVTRAEFAVMLMNALNPQGDGAALTFADKEKIGAWAQTSVALAVQAGILAGYEDGTFRPNARITRSEMAVMIAKALGRPVEAATATGFADDKDIPGWARGAVEATRKLGIIEGKGANAFAPGDRATRAESVTVLLKLLAQKDK
ncbi:S-layer homology domain-containing protein [Cohnella sp. 56]|uniref:S-layer homology domain-containing protein n=1 Tax=Cohnella sp. 56 TaxID=3113722 RepID=UPI0030EA0734